jgi:hypothetical protein
MLTVLSTTVGISLIIIPVFPALLVLSKAGAAAGALAGRITMCMQSLVRRE